MKNKKKAPKKLKKEIEKGRIAFNFSFAVIAILIIFIFSNDLFLAAILETILGFVGLFVWKSKATTTVFIMGGLWGTLIQMAIISASQGWQYISQDNLTLFPFWMIIIFANASAFIYETTKELDKLRKNE